jgi:RNA recognition motif-containing protein
MILARLWPADYLSRLRSLHYFSSKESIMSSMNLYVGNLSYNLKEADLAELFAPYGQVESAKIITDRYSGQSKGFGFVEMASRADGEKAIQALNGQSIQNRQLKVNEAKPKTDDRRGGGGGGRGGNGGGGGGGRRY